MTPQCCRARLLHLVTLLCAGCASPRQEGQPHMLEQLLGADEPSHPDEPRDRIERYRGDRGIFNNVEITRYSFTLDTGREVTVEYHDATIRRGPYGLQAEVWGSDGEEYILRISKDKRRVLAVWHKVAAAGGFSERLFGGDGLRAIGTADVLYYDELNEVYQVYRESRYGNGNWRLAAQRCYATVDNVMIGALLPPDESAVSSSTELDILVLVANSNPDTLCSNFEIKVSLHRRGVGSDATAYRAACVEEAAVIGCLALAMARQNLEGVEQGVALRNAQRVLATAELNVARNAAAKSAPCRAASPDAIAESARQSGNAGLMVRAARLQIAAGQPLQQIVPTVRAAVDALAGASDGFVRARAALDIAHIVRSLREAADSGSELSEYLASHKDAIRRPIEAYLRDSDLAAMRLAVKLEAQNSGAMTFSGAQFRDDIETVTSRVNRMKDLLYYGESRFVPAVGTLSLQPDGLYMAAARERGASAVVSFVPVDPSKPFGSQAIATVSFAGEHGLARSHRVDFRDPASLQQ